jgi:hypothetical protein
MLREREKPKQKSTAGKILEGQRNDSLFKTGCRLRAKDLDASEIEAIRFARASAADIIKGLIVIATTSKSESQRRQASEVVLKYALADREQQFNVDGKPVAGTTVANISMTKVDLQFNVAMEKLPPMEKVKVAEALEILERFSAQENIELIEGEVKEVELGPKCKCGCGGHVKMITSGPKRGQYATWIQGHHLRKHVAAPEVVAARARMDEVRAQKGKPKKVKAK